MCMCVVKIQKLTEHSEHTFNQDATWRGAVAVLGWGQGAQAPPNLAQAPQYFQGNYGT